LSPTPAGAERSSAFPLQMRNNDLVMPVPRRHFAPGQLQFISRASICASQRQHVYATHPAESHGLTSEPSMPRTT
jgi:hypothetical protein